MKDGNSKLFIYDKPLTVATYFHNDSRDIVLKFTIQLSFIYVYISCLPEGNRTYLLFLFDKNNYYKALFTYVLIHIEILSSGVFPAKHKQCESHRCSVSWPFKEITMNFWQSIINIPTEGKSGDCICFYRIHCSTHGRSLALINRNLVIPVM